MSEIDESPEFEEILANVNFDAIDISYSPMESQNDEAEELLGVAPAPQKDASSTDGLATREGVCGCTRAGPDPRQGSSPFPPPCGYGT